MFKPLRRKRIVQVIMWVLVVSFVVWGAGSAARTARNYAGIIFGKKISPQKYSRAYYAVFNRAKMVYGDKLPKMQKFLNLEGQAWDRLILLYYAKKKRIRANNKEVIERIASMPFFQSEGSFNQKAYNYIVQNIFGTTARNFEESVREDIMISKIIDSVEKDTAITEEEIKESYKTKNEKADISYILINTDSFKKDVATKESELEPFYNSHKEQFRTSEERNVYYINLPYPEKEGAEDEKEKTRQLAREINDYLNLGEDFNALAKKYNLKIKETGSFSFGEAIPGIGLSYPFSMVAFGLSEERANNVVEDTKGFYVIKLKEKISPFIPPFEQVKEDVRSALVTHKTDGLAKAASQNYANLLKSQAVSLENLSEQIKSDIINLKDITRESYIKDIGYNVEFSNACFAIKEKGFAGPIKVQKGYCLIRLDKLKPIDTEIFQKEKQEFRKSLLEEKKKKAFQDWFANLKQKANLKPNL
ncbi:MAG: SurA N-terminal domain-containing protein [Candidatus Omnitrophota bacterium]|nr:MAG: SurA N-terminal domain-containing protein [Candidatus Omnitrophota bacterium]